MLNGIDPIIIFNLKKTVLTNEEFQALPIAQLDEVTSQINLPPIPIYLSEKLTGLFIDSEDKNIDIQTDTESLVTGKDPIVKQRAIASTISVNLVANKNSVGLSLLSAMVDSILAKVTSREYSIDYLHGAVTLFGGLIHSYSVNQSANNELLTIKIELSKGSTAKPNVVGSVPVQTGAIPVGV